MANNIVELKVEGMSCNNCAAGLNSFLERKGLEDVYVNFATSEVRFRQSASGISLAEIRKGIHKMGYKVVEEENPTEWWTLERKLLISAIFTAPLLLMHLLMAAGIHLTLMENYRLQFAICLPAFIIGFLHFGKSVFGSLKGGILNMDVLIFVGSTAAFIYSLIGTLLREGNYIFYETSAMIITLVLLGNWLEKRAVEQTTTAIGELSKLQVEKAKKVMPSGAIVLLGKDEIQKGDILQVNEGDKLPADGIVISGNGLVDEAMLTGESAPVEKETGAPVIGASLLNSGNFRMEVTAAGRDTVLSQMIELVKTAQQDKPEIQRLADRISAIFVPVVLLIALATLLIAFFGFGLPFSKALMNSIAVLVISCPCAMGLATPTAVMVGVGRLAKSGILVKGGQTVEIFTRIKNFVFDKTGTLTSGEFKINKIQYHTGEEEKVNALIYNLEQHSSHPIAQSLVREMAGRANGFDLGQLTFEERRGVGVVAKDNSGNLYKIGSGRILSQSKPDTTRQIYLTENDQLLASIEITDQIKPEARAAIQYLKSKGLRAIILSGDKVSNTQEVASNLGVEEFYAEKLPEEKLRIIEKLSKESPTAMVGDGINDAPALARATLGVSLSDGSQAAIQSAQIVLLNGNLGHLRKAIAISNLTVKTIKQNLFWAFAYNIVAIPIAALGFLNPMWGALFMAFSDVVVIGNSIRLKGKKIR